MQVYRYPQKEEWDKIIQRPELEKKQLLESVASILAAVKKDGDKALKHYTRLYDKVNTESIKLRTSEWKQSGESLNIDVRNAIILAAKNIRKFHQSQVEQSPEVETMPGIRCWRKSLPVERVGLYIPGGTAPLFSTILMLAIPASIAGCKDIILCTPPSSDGTIHPAILYAADICGVSKIFAVGGVQAIAAMAYGTETVPKVDKIFGPGNQYVTAAKQLIQQEGIAIDLPAGPSEVCVLADHEASPAFIAADLISQAEHGIDSQVLLVSTSDDIVRLTLEELELQTKRLPRKDVALTALNNSRAVVMRDIAGAVELINNYAPEHLIISCMHDEEIASKITSAGSVFLGAWSPESAGDYASGTNHTLPTNGYARAYSGVSVDSFVKKVTFQKLTREGLTAIAPAVIAMAECEGLMGHAEAVRARMKSEV